MRTEICLLYLTFSTLRSSQNAHDEMRSRLVSASYPDVSLLMKLCAQRKAGRRQREDVTSPAVCILPMVPCGSSPVTCFALASAMRKTKRLRRRLGLCARPNKSLFLVNPSQEQVPSVHPNGTTETVYKART